MTISSTPRVRLTGNSIIGFFVLCCLLGVPLSWPKTSGGDTISWVGFEILHKSHSLGISERRSQWFVQWCREVVASYHVQMTNFEEGLGRVMYIFGALEYERPFLGPLYRFMVVHPRGLVQKLPGFFRLILRFLADQVEKNRHYPCAVEVRQAVGQPRVDAQASSTRTGIGGWLPVTDDSGVIQTRLLPWFSVEVDRVHFPWVYEKNDSLSLTIATLEALAILFALKAFYGETPQANRTTVQILPTWTENRGNGALLNKLMSTKTPICAVLMELPPLMQELEQKTTVNWTPRTANREADSLANGDASEFDRALEVEFRKDRPQCRVLPEALEIAGGGGSICRGEEERRPSRPHQEAGPTTSGTAHQSH